MGDYTKHDWTDEEYAEIGGEIEAFDLSEEEVDDLRRIYAERRRKAEEYQAKKERQAAHEKQMRDAFSHFLKIRMRRSDEVYDVTETPDNAFKGHDNPPDAYLLVNYLHFLVNNYGLLSAKDLWEFVPSLRKFSHKDRARLLMRILTDQFIEQLSLDESIEIAAAVYDDPTYPMQAVLREEPWVSEWDAHPAKLTKQNAFRGIYADDSLGMGESFSDETLDVLAPLKVSQATRLEMAKSGLDLISERNRLKKGE